MRKILRGLCAVAFACVLLYPGGGDKAWGFTVSLEQARLLAENWLAATTPYGQGMVYYTGFPVPSTSSSAFLSLRQDNRTPSAERALAPSWRMRRHAGGRCRFWRRTAVCTTCERRAGTCFP